MSVPGWRFWLGCTAAIAGLWALAVVQPILDLLSRAPEFFLAHHADRLDVLTTVALLVLGAPLAAGAVLGLTGLIGRRTMEAAAGVVVGALTATAALQVSYHAGVSTWRAAAWVGVAAAALGCAGWLALRVFKAAVILTSVAALVVPASFLSSAGVRAVMNGGTVQAATRQASQLAPVVLIVFDELPLVTFLDGRGRLDATRYPHIAALAADGVWFRNTTTVSDYTSSALPAILSGQAPKAGSFPISVDYPHTLFTLLASSHRMKVLEPITALCPASLCERTREPFWERQRQVFADLRIVALHVLLPPGARAALPAINEGWAGFDAKEADFNRYWTQQTSDDVKSTAMAFVDGIVRSDGQPTLYFMHTMLSHRPPRWLPSGQSITDFSMPPGELPDMVWTTSEWPVILNQQAELVHAGLVDRLIGRLVTRLREAEIYDRAMVVMTSDHGLSFRPGDRLRSLTETNAGEILPVPLIIKMPSDRQMRPAGTVDDQNVETIDILPTIADGLGIRIPWPVSGASAFRSGSSRPDKRVYVRDNLDLKRFTTDHVARLRDAAARRKTEIFGSGTWPSPSPPGLGDLIGRSVESLNPEEAPGGLPIQIDHLFALDDVSLQASSLPVQATGRLLAAPAGQDLAAVPLAVALNGEIVASTRTHSDTGEWRALLPPDRLRNGRNDLDVFVVVPSRPRRLVRTMAPRRLPPDVDVLFGDVARFGMTYEGFHHRERAGDTPFHWTDGAALIRVPIDADRKPATLSLGVLQAARQGMPLRILIDDCEVATVAMPGGPWSKDLPIARCVPNARWMTIRFLSETVRPGDRDKRRLGVALTQVRLR